MLVLVVLIIMLCLALSAPAITLNEWNDAISFEQKNFSYEMYLDGEKQYIVTKTNSNIRIEAAIIYTLNQVCYQQGFTFLTDEQLINSCIKLLDAYEFRNKIIESLDRLVKNKKIILENGKYFSYRLEVIDSLTEEEASI